MKCKRDSYYLSLLIIIVKLLLLYCSTASVNGFAYVIFAHLDVVVGVSEIEARLWALQVG